MNMTQLKANEQKNAINRLIAEATELLKNAKWTDDPVGYAQVLTQDIEALEAAVDRLTS